MNLVRKYVEGLDDSEKELIILGHEKLETEGAVGDEPIRIHAQTIMKQLGADSNVVMWMQLLAFECCYSFAKRYLVENPNG